MSHELQNEHCIWYRETQALYLAACFVCSLVLAVFLAGLPLEAFLDRANYMVYARDSITALQRYASRGPVALLTNEPVWLLLNIALVQLFPPEWVLRIIILLPAWVAAWIIFKQDFRLFPLLLIIFLLPQVLKNHVIHLRQGLAAALFLLGYYSTQRSVRNGLLLLTPFIHSSFFIVLPLYYLRPLLELLRFSSTIRVLLVALVGIVIGLAGMLGAGMLGARQAGRYALFVSGGSGLGFVYWSLLLCVLLSEGPQFIRRHIFEIAILFFYIGTYFLIPVGARVMESVLILILLAGVRLTCWRYFLFIAMHVFFFAFQYYQRLGQPWLGWGV